MIGVSLLALVNRVTLFVFLILVCSPAVIVAQCVDSSVVTNFTVRSVKFRSLFGRVPEKLRTQLKAHQGETYSAAQASNYIRQIDQFLDNDPIQQKYETLVANKLKFSLKGVYTELACVKPVSVSECQQAFGGAVTQCVDVSIRRYSVEVDGLNSSPYLLLFPRSALTALYGALPRPLLALNPNFDFNQDRSFGPSLLVDTATDLLDFRATARGTPAKQSAQPQIPVAPPTPTVPGDVEIGIPGTDVSAVNDSANDEIPRNTKLLFRFSGRKSLSKDFYDTSSALMLERARPLQLLQSFKVDARFDSQHVPQGNGEFLRNAASFGLSTDLRLKSGPFQLITFGGAYAWSRNRFTDQSGLREISSENGYGGRLLLDGVVKKGFIRAAVWFDGGAPNIPHSHYGRLAGVAGYGKEFIVSRKKQIHKIHLEDFDLDCWTAYANEPRRNEQTVGLEVIVGAGRTWGDVPEYGRFFGGNQSGQFLYDELTSPAIQGFPSGPLIRSVGQGRAGIGSSGGILGATSYWHANVNVSLPNANWSVPLIPHSWEGATPLNKDDTAFGNSVPEGELICRDLKYMVKRAVRRSGMILMIHQEAFNSLTDEQKKAFELQEKPDLTPEEQARLDAAKQAYTEAKLKVRPEVELLFRRDVLPISDFIADHANLIAVKPLLLFDVAHLSSSRGLKEPTRFGSGPGLQVDVVLARLELGYVFGINREQGDPRGQFVGRLVFRRLF